MLWTGTWRSLLTRCTGTLCTILLTAFASTAGAASFAFSGVDERGTGSAVMDISIVGTTLTLTLDNTSPTTLNSPYTGPNAPGILGFGFNLVDPNPLVTAWSLTAYVDAAQTMLGTIGGHPISGLDTWSLGTTLASVTFDYLPQSDGPGVKGAIYNPAATSGFAAPPNYFSTATLVMTFASAPLLDLTTSPYVRMQNVGKQGKGSLKLFGTPTGGGGPGGNPVVPEPASVALFAVGLVCCAGHLVRRRRKVGHATVSPA